MLHTYDQNHREQERSIAQVLSALAENNERLVASGLQGNFGIIQGDRSQTRDYDIAETSQVG
jgi:hypothetical protein